MDGSGRGQGKYDGIKEIMQSLAAKFQTDSFSICLSCSMSIHSDDVNEMKVIVKAYLVKSKLFFCSDILL